MNSSTSAVSAPLADHFLPAISQSWIKQLAIAFGLTVILTATAKVSIPFYPVPMTLQVLVVLLLGFVFGSRFAALTVGLYLLEGAVGLPVFAGTTGLGIAYMMGPTGGYLVGFLFAAFCCGKLAENGWGKTKTTTFLGMLIGLAIIFACGLLWLSNFVGWGSELFQLGLIPFIPGGLLKIAMAVIALPSLWALAGNSDVVKKQG